MRYRLIIEQDGEHRSPFWMVQQHHWFFGWHCVKSVDSVTTNEQVARQLFDRVRSGAPITFTKVIEEITQ